MEQACPRLLHRAVLAVPLLAILFHSLALDTFYKGLLYLNIPLLVLLASNTTKEERRTRLRPAFVIAGFAVSFALIDLISSGPLGAKEIRHLFMYSLLALTIVFWPREAAQRQATELFKGMALLIIAYTIIQSVSVFYFSDRSGITKNTHYLAQYCLLFTFAGIFLVRKTEGSMKALLLITIAALGLMLIQTGSRTAWLGLLAGMSVLFILQRRLFRWRAVLVVLAALLLSYAMNAGNFRTKIDDLAQNIGKEERVTIWKEAAEAQRQSSTSEWLFGHGLDSFKDAFKAYSSYHHKGRDFNAPHNFVLEIIFTAGIAGLLVTVILFIALLNRMYRFHASNPDALYPALLIAALIANTVFAAITISFYTSYHLLILALIGGFVIFATAQPPTNGTANSV